MCKAVYVFDGQKFVHGRNSDRWIVGSIFDTTVNTNFYKQKVESLLGGELTVQLIIRTPSLLILLATNI